MSIDIWTDSMQHAELFGKPVLFTNWLIQRDTIPQGWHCYDLRGTRKAPNARITLVDQEAGYSVWCDDSIALINEEQGGFIAVKGVQLLFAGAAAIQHHVMISADLL